MKLSSMKCRGCIDSLECGAFLDPTGIWNSGMVSGRWIGLRTVQDNIHQKKGRANKGSALNTLLFFSLIDSIFNDCSTAGLFYDI